MSSAEFNALNQAMHAASERGVEPDAEWFANLRSSSLTIPGYFDPRGQP